MFEDYAPNIRKEAMNVIAQITGRHPKAKQRQVSQHKKNLRYLKKILG